MQPDNSKESITLPNELFLPEVIARINEGHTVTLPLRGYSMRPFLENGRDKALLTRVHRLKVGEPVLAEITRGKYVLHRIISIDGNRITLLGDGNITPEHCTDSDIRACVEGFYRKGSKRLDRIDGRKWMIYSWVWTRLRPIRRYLLFIYRHLFTH